MSCLVRREFREAVGPVAGDAKRRRGIQHLGSPCPHAVDQRDGFLGGIVGKAEDDEVHFLHQRALRAGILALFLGDAFHRDIVLQVEALANAEARRSRRAVNEYGRPCGGAGGRGLAVRPLCVGEGHGTFLPSAGAPAPNGEM